MFLRILLILIIASQAFSSFDYNSIIVQMKLSPLLSSAIVDLKNGRNFNEVVQNYGFISNGREILVAVICRNPECCNEYEKRIISKKFSGVNWRIKAFLNFKEIVSVASKPEVLSIESIQTASKRPYPEHNNTGPSLLLKSLTVFLLFIIVAAVLLYLRSVYS